MFFGVQCQIITIVQIYNLVMKGCVGLVFFWGASSFFLFSCSAFYGAEIGWEICRVPNRGKYPILRINTIKISSKKIPMKENRRFTRSSTSTIPDSLRSQAKEREIVDIELRIKKAAMEKKFNEALALLRMITPQSHWVMCKKAAFMFELGRTLRSLNAVRNALRNQRNNCMQCLKLLLKIIQRNGSNVRKFSQDIADCLALENLPPKIKAQLLAIENSITNQDSQNSKTSIEQFTSYYLEKGVKFRKVQILEVDEYYRVARARSTIKPNEVIIFVPQKQMITLEIVKLAPEIQKLVNEEFNLKSPKHCLLSAYLLLEMEKGNESPYYKYIQCLPKSLSNFPIFFSDQLLQQLRGTYFLTLIHRKKSDIKQDYNIITNVLPELVHILTYDKFVWARMIVSSRIFGVSINGKKTDALVPIADMLNHKIPKMTSWYFSDEKRGFVVQNSEQEILKGNEIFDSYGFKCNSRFLLNYGFTIPDNSCNQVLIKVKKDHGNRMVSIPNIKLTTDIESLEFKKLISYYREQVALSNNSSITSKDPPASMPFLSHQNEGEVWREIHKTMKHQLGQYRTSIRKDQQLLRCLEPRSDALRNCIEIRLGEKKILDFFQQMAKKMIQFFDGANREKYRSTDALREYQTYFRDLGYLDGTKL